MSDTETGIESDSDGESDEIAALRDRISSLEDQIGDLEMRYEAAMTKNELLKEIVLGDLEFGEDQVREAPSLWMQIADQRTAVANHGDRLDRLDSAGARGQPGAARKAKIRHALVRRAAQSGMVSTTQAAQADAPALDYEDVLALFDYEIGESYASKLLDEAARENAAFWIKEPSNPRDGRKALRVDVTELDEDSPYLRSVRQNAEPDSANEDFAEFGNNEQSEGGR